MITVAQLLDEHVSLDIECVDRLYLNGYVPSLQTPQGLVTFMREPILASQRRRRFCSAG